MRLLNVLQEQEQGINELMSALEIQNKSHFRKSYLMPALELKLIEMTLPEKPTSRYQQYRLTALGHQQLQGKKV